jgi:Fe-S cluster assembly iron-binding protein IscA
MPEITITETAQKKITKLLSDHENKFLRISIQGIG